MGVCLLLLMSLLSVWLLTYFLCHTHALKDSQPEEKFVCSILSNTGLHSLISFSQDIDISTSHHGQNGKGHVYINIVFSYIQKLVALKMQHFIIPLFSCRNTKKGDFLF